MLWRSLEVLKLFSPPADASTPHYQDVRESVEAMHFYADELLESANNLTNLQLSLSSQKTNQVMRILTVFSAFFLPLTFLVGVYGMNFEYMPELSQRWGYPAVWAVMVHHHAGDLHLGSGSGGGSSRDRRPAARSSGGPCRRLVRARRKPRGRGGTADAVGPHLLPDPALEWLRASLGAMAVWAVEAERGDLPREVTRRLSYLRRRVTTCSPPRCGSTGREREERPLVERLEAGVLVVRCGSGFATAALMPPGTPSHAVARSRTNSTACSRDSSAARG